MAWWQPKEEENPQSRVGRTRIGTTRPVEEEAKGLGEHLGGTSERVDDPPHRVSSSELPTYSSSSSTHVPTYGGLPSEGQIRRWRWNFNLLIGVIALVFVLAVSLPFLFAFNSFDFGGSDSPGGFDLSDHDGPSLVQRERFSKAMAKIRDSAGSEASLTALRVEPERIDAVVTKAGGGLATIQVLPDLHVRSFGASTGAGQRGLSLSKIDPAVPERLVRRAAERVGAQPDDLNYMALAGVGGSPTWAIFFSGGGTGRFVTADLDGKNLRVPGS